MKTYPDEQQLGYRLTELTDAMRYVYKMVFIGPREQLEAIVDSIKDGHFPLFDTSVADEQACIYNFDSDDHTWLDVSLPTHCDPQSVREVLTEAYPPEVKCRCWVSLENVTVTPGEAQ